MCIICNKSEFINDVTHLTICKYANIPNEILPNITRIDCSNNLNVKGQLNLFNFPNINHLNISYSKKITCIASKLMKKLIYLNARNTNLSHLPKINNCKLYELNLTNTRITSLPNCYNNIKIKRLRNSYLDITQKLY